MSCIGLWRAVDRTRNVRAGHLHLPSPRCHEPPCPRATKASSTELTSTTARWTSLSSSADTPSGGCRPSAFAMYARRTGLARYAPRFTRLDKSWRLAPKVCPYDFHVSPSTPAAPASTRGRPLAKRAEPLRGFRRAGDLSRSTRILLNVKNPDVAKSEMAELKPLNQSNVRNPAVLLNSAVTFVYLASLLCLAHG